ncbi:MAG: hypothetical protein RAP03_09620, partial [Candidatus Electryonea clarkiae]|nr:hypothetical protein [Candidatus Electryonea clarkiae]
MKTDEKEFYLLENLAAHLAQTKSLEKLHQLLVEYKYMFLKLNRLGPMELIADYDYLENENDYLLIQKALRLSAHILAKDPDQLWSQIYGRLNSIQNNTIGLLLSHNFKSSWIKSLNHSLNTPDSALHITLDERSDPIDDLCFIDNHRIVSASEDHNLRVWNLKTGKIEKFLIGHQDEVTVVKVLLRHRLIASGSDDGTIKIWDIETGDCLKSIDGHVKGVKSMTILRDERILSLSKAGQCRLLSIDNNTNSLRVIGDREDKVIAFSFAENNRTLLTGTSKGKLCI